MILRLGGTHFGKQGVSEKAAGTVGVYAAYHLFAGMPDGYHFIYFFHAIVVVPAGLWGAICMARHGAGTRVRSLGLAAAAAMAVTGVHDMVAFHNRRLDTLWRPSDLATIHAELSGRPFGYFASSDRGWWIPMRAVLGSLLDSRCVRLSVIDERHRDASRYYGFGAPFALVPPKRGENPDAWSLRFARKLGIRHVISTPENPVPAKVRARCKPVASAPGLMLYELPEAPDPGPQALPQPAAQTAAQAAAPQS